MITWIVIAVVLLLAVALVVAVALERGPGAADVAIAYEEAIDRHDATTLWGLVGPELRGGLGRQEFVAQERRRLADEPRCRVAAVEVADEFSGRVEASVLTVVHLTDGSSTRRRTRCEKHQGEWRVRSVSDVAEVDLPDGEVDGA